MDTEKLWTRNFITLSLINFLIFLTYLLLMVTIASYAIDEFDASINMAGLVASIYIIGVLIGRLVTGRNIDHAGSKKVLIVGLLLYIITSGLYFGVINVYLLLINRTLQGIAGGVASTAVMTIVAKSIPQKRYGEGIGYFSLSSILAVALGSFVGVFLIQYFSFNTIFMFNLALSVISFILGFVIEPAQQSFAKDQADVVKITHISNFIEFKTIPISIIAMIMGFCYSAVLAFMALYAKQIHLFGSSSFFFLAYAAAILVSRPFSGRLLDAKGSNFVMYPCMLIFAAGMFLFSQAGHGITFLLAGALIGLGYGNIITCAQAISIKAIPSNRLGLATATYFIFIDLGIGVGPYLLGSLVPFLGYRGLYFTAAMLILATIIFYYLLHGRKSAA